ncbi:MAG: hypothetical protein JWQ86_415 [Mycobacterium sp.]|jgi:hypothetical protein|nr:hypothetical protein [Mycobacterium sp.]
METWHDRPCARGRCDVSEKFCLSRLLRGPCKAALRPHRRTLRGVRPPRGEGVEQ